MEIVTLTTIRPIALDDFCVWLTTQIPRMNLSCRVQLTPTESCDLARTDCAFVDSEGYRHFQVRQRDAADYCAVDDKWFIDLRANRGPTYTTRLHLRCQFVENKRICDLFLLLLERIDAAWPPDTGPLWEVVSRETTVALEVSEEAGLKEALKRLPAWLAIPAKGWARLAVQLWWEGLNTTKITEELAIRMSHISKKVVQKKLVELRKQLGTDVVPYVNDLIAMGIRSKGDRD